VSREQVSDQFGGQQLQTQARPVAATEQAAAPEQETRWKGLADVFAQGAGLADTIRQQAEVDDKNAAKRWAQSMTVGELGKAIQEGKLMPSQSPVFVGTAQHIWGVNSHEAGMRDLTSKLSKGELKFNSPEEADQYLTEWRNTTLAGQSDYAKAGFDKAYSQTRDRVMDQVSKINDGVWVENAKAQATDFLANTLNAVSQSDFKGTPQEAAAQLMSQYQLMRHTKTLPDAAARGAMGEMLVRMAGSGRKDILDAFLDSDMDGIGKVRSFVGETKAMTLIHQATAVDDQSQRQRIDSEMLPWYKAADAGSLNVTKLEAWAADPANAKYVSSGAVHSLTRANMTALADQQRTLDRAKIQVAVQESEHKARQHVDAALAEGSLWRVQGTGTPQVITPNGDVRDFNVKEYATQALVVRTAGTGREMVARWAPGTTPTPQQIERAAAGTGPMPLHQQVSVWAQNGLDNPNWKNELSSGFLNLSTIGVASKGKPSGQLNEAGQRAIALFRELDKVNADYVRGLVGEKTYERFSDIAFLMHLGRSPDDAAGLAAGAALGAIADSDVGKLTKKVNAQVAMLTEGPWYKPDWAAKIMGENTTANTAQVSGTLRRYANLLAHSGQYADAEVAVSTAFSYLANDAVSGRINGTLYLRSEMPSGPPSRTQEDWFGRFIDEVPKGRAKELFGKPQDVRMEWNPASRAYQAYVGGVPLTNADHTLAVYSRETIQKWYATKEQADILEAAAKGSAKVNAVKDTRAAGERISEWAKQVEAGTLPKAPPRTEAPEKPMRNIPDFWMTREGQAVVTARKGAQGGHARPR
jgi:hypothetical protein